MTPDTLRPQRRTTWLILSCFLFPVGARAVELTASDWAAEDNFGTPSTLSGGIGLVSAAAKDGVKGVVYLFNNLDTSTGTLTETAKLTASDGAARDYFGISTSIQGNAALVGAAGNESNKGAAYFFRSLHTAAGSVTEDLKLIASDGSASDIFGRSVSLWGNAGLVGAPWDNDLSGSAYLYRNLDTSSGTITEDVKLVASNGGVNVSFGSSSSLCGQSALVGAHMENGERGAAYLFRKLDTASGIITEDVKLTASDAAPSHYFGASVSLSGSSGLIGTLSSNATYLFRGLDTAIGTVTENARLTASDTASNGFGGAVSLSGDSGLVGASRDNDSRGAAYLFKGLDAASGAVTETVKLKASVAAANDNFGWSVAVEGDSFIIGSFDRNKAYTGRVSAFTTLDAGGATRFTDGLSFVSQDNWVAGQNSDHNLLVLSAGDSGTVTAAGKKVMVGQNAGSDGNILAINGSLTANTVLVGAAGNTGNSLWVGGGGIVTTTGGVILSPGSIVGGDGTINGNLKFSAASSLIFSTNETLTVNGSLLFDGSFGVTNLIGLDVNTPNGIYTLIDGTTTNFAASGLSNWGEANAYDLGGGKSAWFEAGSLRLVVVPEADTSLLVLLAGTSAALRRRSSRRRLQSV